MINQNEKMTTFTSQKIGKALFRKNTDIEILLKFISQKNRQQILFELERPRLVHNGFCKKMFKEMEYSEAQELHMFMFDVNFLKQIQHINFINLKTLNLLECSISNIQALNSINTCFLGMLSLRNNQIYRMKTLAKCLPAKQIKLIYIQKSPIQLMNEDQLFKKLQFKSRDSFNVFVYVTDESDTYYIRHPQRLKYSYYNKIPKMFKDYKLNFNEQYKKYQKMFYFPLKQDSQLQNQLQDYN